MSNTENKRPSINGLISLTVIAKGIERLTAWLQSIAKRLQIASDSKANFVDLTPVDNANNFENYEEALVYAFQNPRINNFAITGPYGSGKSSLIATFKRRYHAYRFLTISLATFGDDNEGGELAEPGSPSRQTKSEDRQLEKSILQQMLYGADANRLPYSRFKRIKTPKLALLKAGLLVFWSVAIYICLQIDILSFLETLPLLASSLTAALLLSLPLLIIADLYRASFGLSFKKLSIKNAEIETGSPSSESIFNKHLDEIIYFFQSTNYNAVIIEDLDRYGRPEIFTKLREINKLINDNSGISGKVKFVYAIKDSMFKDKDRSKFFDFVIPVVPTVNSFNALDKMLERQSRITPSVKINKEFLREISWHINDLRLIHNIFNEFQVYRKSLRSPKLDTTKLLALITYKNVYPYDFEQLHNNQGALCYLCSLKNREVESSIQSKREEIDSLKQNLSKVRSEIAESEKELISLYVGSLPQLCPNPTLGVILGNQIQAYSQLLNAENFKRLRNLDKIVFVGNGNNQLRSNKSFSDLEELLGRGATFPDRLDLVTKKHSDRQQEVSKQIQLLEREIYKVRAAKLSDLCAGSQDILDEAIQAKDLPSPELFIYLVRNGYLDENYLDYITNFEEGRLTKTDRDFLVCIRNGKLLPPTHEVPNPEEVCAGMRDEDFHTIFALNVSLVDYLVSSTHEVIRIRHIIEFISRNYDESEDFLKSFYDKGSSVSKFVKLVCLNWPNYASVSTKSATPEPHLINILKYAEKDEKFYQANTLDGLLANFLSTKGEQILYPGTLDQSEFTMLTKLEVSFVELSALVVNDEILTFAIQNDLYEINISNILFICDRLIPPGNADSISPKKQNYGAIRRLDCEPVINYIESNLSEYIHNVFLKLEDNTDENEESVTHLIESEDLELDEKKEVISKQSFIFKDFHAAPVELWNHLLNEGKIRLTWKNLASYLKYDAEGLNDWFLDSENDEAITEVCKNRMQADAVGKENASEMSNFIIHNDKLSADIYSKAIKCIPFYYEALPQVEKKKQLVAISFGKVSLCERSFQEARMDSDLVSSLILKNPKEYFENPAQYPLNDEIRSILLESNISSDRKILICKQIDINQSHTNRRLLAAVCDAFIADGVDLSEFSFELKFHAIKNSNDRHKMVRLLLRLLQELDEDQTMQTLRVMPPPYREIAGYGKRPKIRKNQLNEELVSRLLAKGYISSCPTEGNYIRVNTKRQK